jgi:hypothetical protein
MSNPFNKFKEIFAVAEPIAKVFVPGAAGSILDQVAGGLNGSSPASADAIKQLAADNDSQTAAIMAIHERLKVVEAKTAHL